LADKPAKNMANFFFKSSFCQNNRKALVEEGFNPTHQIMPKTPEGAENPEGFLSAETRRGALRRNPPQQHLH
jgi:hypothetical protein